MTRNDGRAQREATEILFAADALAASEAALSRARNNPNLQARSRNTALRLSNHVKKVVELHNKTLSLRTQFEREAKVMQPEPLRDKWKKATAEIATEAQSLRKEIAALVPEVTEALEREASPTVADPSAQLLARQEVELALRTNPDTARRTLVELAGRGGELGAAAASDWGRLTLASMTGSDAGFDAVRRAAITAAKSSPVEGQRLAAEALEATAQPRPGRSDRVSSLTEAHVKSGAVLESLMRIVNDGPAFDGA